MKIVEDENGQERYALITEIISIEDIIRANNVVGSTMVIVQNEDHMDLWSVIGADGVFQLCSYYIKHRPGANKISISKWGMRICTGPLAEIASNESLRKAMTQ